MRWCFPGGFSRCMGLVVDIAIGTCLPACDGVAKRGGGFSTGGPGGFWGGHKRLI